MLAQQLVGAGVDTSLVRWSDAPTAHALVHQQHDGSNAYTFELDGTSLVELGPQDVPVLPDDAWGVYVGTLSLAVDPPAAASEALVDREAGRRLIVLDPNVRAPIFGDAIRYRLRFERLARHTDLVKLSEDDAAWIYPDTSVESVLDLILGLGPRVVALTKGKDGAVASSGNGFVDVPGIPVTVVYTVGAGDSRGAAFGTALVAAGAFGPHATQHADGTVLAGAVSYAVAASAITCTRTGAVPPSRGEIEAELRLLGGAAGVSA